jgi:Protein of unknown function (DUF1761)
MFEKNDDGQKINYIATVVTGLAAFALSLLWYSPFLFGNIWLALRNAPVHPLPGWTFLFAPLREIISAFLLTHLIVRLGVNNWKNALGLGFVLWFSFYFVQLTGAVMWDNLPWQLGLVHSGDWLMKMLPMSLLLNAWHGSRQSSEMPLNKQSKATI